MRLLAALVASAALVLVPAFASQAVTQTQISTAQYPVGLAEDASGNIYIADENNTQIKVVPAISGTLFGVSVTAGVEAVLLNSPSSYARGVAVNAQGDLFYASSDSKLKVIAGTAKTLFGVSVSANTPTVVSNAWDPGALDFAPNGSLYGVGVTTDVLQVLPATTGTTFGVNVTANTRAVIPTYNGAWLWDLAIDPSGNVLLADGWGIQGVYIIPVISGTSYGQSVSQNTAVRLSAFGATHRRAGIDVDASGNLFSAVYGGWVDVYSPTGQDMFGQVINPNTVTMISDTSSVTNQGLLVTSSGDLVTGGYLATYRTANYLLAKTVTFRSNGGSGAMTDQLSSTTAHLDGNVFTRPGFTFSGWNSIADGTGTAYQDLANYTFSSDLTLYAQWVPTVTTTPNATLASTGSSAEYGWLLALVSLLAGLTMVLLRGSLLRR